MPTVLQQGWPWRSLPLCVCTGFLIELAEGLGLSAPAPNSQVGNRGPPKLPPTSRPRGCCVAGGLAPPIALSLHSLCLTWLHALSELGFPAWQRDQWAYQPSVRGPLALGFCLPSYCRCMNMCICFPTWPFARDLSHGCHGNPSTSSSLLFLPIPHLRLPPLPPIWLPRYWLPLAFRGGRPMSGSHSKLPGPLPTPSSQTPQTQMHTHSTHNIITTSHAYNPTQSVH